MTAVYEPGGPASDWDDAPMCECGRGPILQGNSTPDCCLKCWEEYLESLCFEHGEADCEECAS
jgi:hypothetical protein